MPEFRLVIGNQNYSSWSLRPWLFLRYHDIAFEQEKVKLFTEHMEQDLSPYFSNNKVPVLQHDGRTIWDSLAILEYLAEHFPEKRGWPVDVEARSVARSVSAEMHSSFFSIRNELPMNCRRMFKGFTPSEEAQQDIHRIQQIWKLCRENYADGGPWLFGEFSIADCMYAPVVLRMLGYAIDLDPVSAEYAAQVYNSTAMQLWVAEGRAEVEVLEEGEAPWPSEPWV